MDWTPYLLPGETLRWQGRPAPRCYTFRNWRHSIFGLLLLAFSLFGLGIGWRLSGEYDLGPWLWLPAPFLAAGLYLAVGHLLLARLQWEKVFFAISDRRLIVLKGTGNRSDSLLSEISHFRLNRLGETLGTLEVHTEGGGRPLSLCCIEMPQIPIRYLKEALAASGRMEPGN
jgi:hypothetical protein